MLNRPHANASVGLRGVVLKGAAWSGSVAVFSAAIQIGVVAALARLLTPGEFGIVAAAAALVAVAQTLSLANMVPALIREPDLTEEMAAATGTFCLVVGCLAFLILQIAAPAIEGLLRVEGSQNVIRVLALVFPLRALAVVSEGLALRKLEFKSLAFRELGSYVFGYASVALICALLGAGYWSLVAAQLAQIALSTLLVWRLVAPKFAVRGLSKSVRGLLRASGGYSFVMFTLHLAANADNIVVARLLGAEALGLYARAYQLMAVPSLIFGKVSQGVLFPAFSKVSSEMGALARAYLRSIEVTALAGLPLTAGSIILAEEIVTLLLGNRWLPMVPAFQILSVGLYFRLSQKSSQAVIRSVAPVRHEAILQLGYLAGVVGGSVLGAPYGIPGVAVGVCAATVIHSSVQGIWACSLSGLRFIDAISIHRAPVLLAIWMSMAWGCGKLFVPPGFSIGLKIVIYLGLTGIALVVTLAAPKLFLGPSGMVAVSALKSRYRRARG